MTPDELAQQCREQIKRFGDEATVIVVMPGRYGKRTTKRLCPGGPVGEILGDGPQGLVVMFRASEVLASVEDDHDAT